MLAIHLSVIVEARWDGPSECRHMPEPGASQDAAAAGERRRVGLCVDCRHGRIVESSRSTRYYLCELSFRRAEYPKYPSVPVVQCDGYDERLQLAPS
jgi:hypothetical protein